ncbi:putative bifunctional diguanylate cyclase/phosphodiesterase [Oricola thermophila]|uniref:Bifunctional diguanylate cyclase/phosphodiesterase n=1 Tax=Oricola thermophila TaxID=2742145 RepID=A0A6N1V7Y6_9HYPH|nr:bifunctional diguanylate cyclase/phosphodiesterase [Oricola thermophila]QKV17076.1 bifunctional diguanylate cyclase/phosphodiesterase [Oricola thermophila]
MTAVPPPDTDFARRVGAAIGQPWWKPVDPVLRDMLFDRESAGNRRIVRWGIWAAVLSHIAFSLLDVLLIPDVAPLAVASRIGTGALFLAILEICLVRRVSRSVLHLAAASAIVAGGVAWILAAIGTTHQANLSYYIVCGTIFILGSNLFFNFKLHVSAIASAIIAVTYGTVIMRGLVAPPGGKLALMVFFASSLALSLYLSWRLALERYHAFLHSQQAHIQEKAAIEYGEKLHEIANTDHLTGLWNRRAIAREFQEMRRARAADGRRIGVILADVDYFKKYNDRLGHQAGDDCLTRLADVFTRTAEANGAVVGRHGGEEFVFLCEVNDTDELARVAADLCHAVKSLGIEHPDRGDGLHVITISAGASLSRRDQGMDLDALLQEADRALYTSKFSGRATWTIFDPEAADDDMSGQNLVDLLKTARTEDLVSTAYQPIRDLPSGRTVGYETLMRLHDFDGSLISPQVFIPEAERSGAIVELGYWAIERAIRDMKRLDPQATVSVNVSGVQLRAPGFPLRVTEIVSREGMPASQLALEITEGMDIFLEPQALKAVEELRSFGLQIWLDDFGTGYAGLACLREYEFDLIKIDKGFLQDSQSEVGLLMLEDMIGLVHHRGIRVLVEGVETANQLRILENLGVDLVQGYLVGRPASVEKHLSRAHETDALAPRRA